jgi:hypothetical protein
MQKLDEGPMFHIGTKGGDDDDSKFGLFQVMFCFPNNRLVVFSTEWFTPQNATWKEATANGTALLQLIARKQVDVVVSDVVVTPSSAEIVTFTVPLITYR